MLKLAKEANCSVGFTTNGAHFDDRIINSIINLQVDLVSFSLAGATKSCHEKKRVGSNFNKLKNNLAQLVSKKESMESDKPKIIFQYMMFKDNLNELLNVVELAYNCKINGIVATNLDYVGHQNQDELKAFLCKYDQHPESDKISIAEDKAKELGVDFYAFPLTMAPTKLCSEDPLNNLYISESGEVSPCVYLNLPIKKIPRFFCGNMTKTPKISYGNINERLLINIWNNDSYVHFRKKFEKRLRGYENSPLPNSCKTCYKAYGI
jgi:MoaA/NifB/PqqE/SkfB family radical SAM enzyme